MAQRIGAVKLAVCLLAGFSSAVTTSSAAPSFLQLDPLPGYTSSASSEVSLDGLVPVGYCYGGPDYQLALWSASGAVSGLGLLPGQTWGWSNGVSGDGSVVVGGSGGNPVNFREACQWTSGTGIAPLGMLPGDITSEAFGVSGDGTIIVGESRSTAFPGEAVRWTEAGGIEGLGFLYVGPSATSRAWAISGDGSVVVGEADQASGGEIAFRWTEAGGMIGVPGTPTKPTSTGDAVSFDGSVMAGSVISSSWDDDEAYRWEAGVLVPLGVLPGMTQSRPSDMNGDGSVIVGRSWTGIAAGRAFYWSASTGMVDLQTFLVDNYGLGTELAGWTLSYVGGISLDGLVITGSGTNPLGETRAWVVNLSPEPGSAVLLALGLMSLWRRARPGRRPGTKGEARCQARCNSVRACL